jgi:two-component system chemotaxis response regulator CheB
MHYHPMPVVICSSLTPVGAELSLSAFDAGAVEVISKPNEHYGLGQLTVDLIAAVRTAAVARRRAPRNSLRPVQVSGPSDCTLIAIGASTGGTVAVEKLVRELPREVPPLLIVQHMPQYITRPFAERLNKLGELRVAEAEDGAWLEPGLALVAPGGQHVMVERLGERLRVAVREGPRVNGHRPSVDVLFASVAKVVGPQALGVLLTGMGKDGAEGMRAMHQRGAHTIAQDEASSVVFGMPKAAIDLGAVEEISPLSEIAARIARALQNRGRQRRSANAPRA